MSKIIIPMAVGSQASGTITENITENGTYNYDVETYKNAEVNVNVESTIALEAPVITQDSNTKAISIENPNTYVTSTIYYTTDGTEPTTNSSVYDSVFIVDVDSTIKSFCHTEATYFSDSLTTVFNAEKVGITYVAVAGNGGSTDIAAYSTNGINWTQTTLPTTAYWRSVCYGNGKYVAVASDSVISAYSIDGINWTQTTLPASARWSSVCYGNGKYVAVALYSNVSAYSTDGITWTQTTMPSSTVWGSVCYGNGKFVSVAGTGGSTTNIAAYSTDGITWTQTTLPTSLGWISVCYGNGKFVAVAYNSSISAYSTDGITWVQTALPASKSWNLVFYGNGKFVASHGSYIAYSTDGIGWIGKGAGVSINAGCYGNGKYVAVSYNSSIAAYSTDGITWTQTTLPASVYWCSVCSKI